MSPQIALHAPVFLAYFWIVLVSLAIAGAVLFLLIGFVLHSWWAAIGFAIGSDRAILSIQESGNLPHLPGLAVFVAWMGAKAYAAAVNIARKLRACGLAVELPPEEMKFKKSLGLADKLDVAPRQILVRHAEGNRPDLVVKEGALKNRLSVDGNPSVQD